MIFTARKTIAGFKHLLTGFIRRCFNLPMDRFSQQGLIDACPGYLDSGEPLQCRRCGYAIVRYNLPDGWTIEGCPTGELKALAIHSLGWVEGLRRLKGQLAGVLPYDGGSWMLAGHHDQSSNNKLQQG